jgi:hypothetical protein
MVLEAKRTNRALRQTILSQDGVFGIEGLGYGAPVTVVSWTKGGRKRKSMR